MEADQRLARLVVSALLGEPTGRVGEDEHAQEEEEGGDDLDAERDAELGGGAEEGAAVATA